MELNEIALFTLRDCPPRSKMDIVSTAKSMQSLPNFTCHIQVQDKIFAASANGSIYSFLPEEPRNPTLIGKHDGFIQCIIYHPIWKLLISGSVDGVVKVWDPFHHYSQSNDPQDLCIQLIQAHNHAIISMAYHGDIFITGSVDKCLKFWKADSERMRFGFNPWFNQMGKSFEYNGWISALWASDSPLVSASGDIIVGDGSGRLTILKSISQTNEPFNIIGIKTVKFSDKFKKQGISMIAMILSHNLQIISTTHGQLRISDSNGINKFCTLDNERSSNYKHVAWNPTYEELILLDSTGNLEIYDYRADRVLLTQIVQPDSKYITFNPYDEELLISGRYGCQLWKITRNIPVKQYLGHEAPVIGLYTYTNIEDGLPQFPGDSSSRPTTASDLEADSDIVSLSSDQLSVAPSESQVSYYSSSVYTQNETKTSQFSTTSTEDGKYKDKVIVSVGQDSKILIWTFDRFSMKVSQSILEENGEIFCSTFIPSMKLVVTGHDSGEIAFNTLQRSPKEKKLYLKAHNNTISCIQYMEFDRRRGPDDSRKYLVTGGFDGKIGMCNITNFMRQYQAPYYEFVRQCYSCTVMCIIENPISDTFISGAADGIIKIWNSRLKLESTLEGHKLGVTALALDGYFLFSSCEDSEVIMWDTLSKVQLKTYNFHNAPINCISLQPKTGNIVSADSNGNIFVWSYSDSNIIFEYHKKGRDFTYIYVDDRENEILAGTDDGSILRIKILENNEEENVIKTSHHSELSQNLNVSNPPSPTQTPRLHIRGNEEKSFIETERNLIIEARLKEKLQSNLFEDEDNLEDIFH